MLTSDYDGVIDFDGQLENLFSANLFSSVRLGIEMAIFNLLRQSGDIIINSKITAIDVNGLVTADDDLLTEAESLLKCVFLSIVTIRKQIAILI